MVQHPQLEAIHDRYMTCLRHFSEYNFPAHPNRVQDLLVKLPEVRPNPLFRIVRPGLRIRIQVSYGSGSSILGWIPIRIQRIQSGSRGFDGQKLKKNYSWKKFVICFWSKTTVYLSLGLHKGRPSCKRSLQLSKENIQHFKTWNFLIFLLLWIIFALPDPLTRLNRDPIRIRNHWPDWIRILFGSGSATLNFTMVSFNIRRWWRCLAIRITCTGWPAFSASTFLPR